MRFTQSVYKQIELTIGTMLPEQGGILGSQDGQIINAYYFDSTGNSRIDSYSPDYEKINVILEDEWALSRTYMVGIVHSHARSCKFPSCGDIVYAEKIMKASNMELFYLPIVCIHPFELFAFSVKMENGKLTVHKETVQIF